MLDPAGGVLALQTLAGNAAVSELLGRPLPAPAHWKGPGRLPTPLQRRVIAPVPPAITRRALTAPERNAFLRRHFSGRERRAAGRVLSDMAAAADPFDFATEDELRTELVKRVTMARVMIETQSPVGGVSAFGYPFTGAALYWGPRVNFAARDYWTPHPPDGYDERRDPAKRAEIRRLPRGERGRVYNDYSVFSGGHYSWQLTAQGRADPWEAIMNLFPAQPPHKRSLLHCDYLVSLVHVRAFMASLGKAAFNARVAAWGPHRLVLRWNLFNDLDLPGVTGGMGSLQQVVPSSPRDLVIGDHVYFWNHPAYDAINSAVGNAWRLENAVLVAKNAGGNDIFLGHGSGRKTAGQMKAKLANEYNRVVTMALRLVARTNRGTSADRAAARAELSTRFPNVHKVAGRWRVQGGGVAGAVDIELRRIQPREVLGLYSPYDPTKLYPVRRPVESA